jgi:HSP20 family protein
MAIDKDPKETAKDMQSRQPASVSRALSPFEEMDRMMESFFPRAWTRPMRWEWPQLAEMTGALEAKMPKVDVLDREAEILVRAELPGVDKKDIDISVTENTVTIKGATSSETKEERGNYFRREISRGSFSRTLALPSEVNSEAAKASFKDGVLELSIPKIERSKRRSIKVE